MAATTSAPPAEDVVFRHRRRPPVLAYGIAGAVMFAVLAVGVGDPLARGALGMAAAAALALGVLGWRRLWVEEQLITSTSVRVVRPDGSAGEIPLERIERIALRGGGIAFIRDDGRELPFARNPHRKRLQAILRESAPSATWVDEVPIACDT